MSCRGQSKVVADGDVPERASPHLGPAGVGKFVTAVTKQRWYIVGSTIYAGNVPCSSALQLWPGRKVAQQVVRMFDTKRLPVEQTAIVCPPTLCKWPDSNSFAARRRPAILVWTKGCASGNLQGEATNMKQTSRLWPLLTHCPAISVSTERRTRE
jgi:hypothetical protein